MKDSTKRQFAQNKEKAQKKEKENPIWKLAEYSAPFKSSNKADWSEDDRAIYDVQAR